MEVLAPVTRLVTRRPRAERTSFPAHGFGIEADTACCHLSTPLTTRLPQRAAWCVEYSVAAGAKAGRRLPRRNRRMQNPMPNAAARRGRCCCNNGALNAALAELRARFPSARMRAGIKGHMLSGLRARFPPARMRAAMAFVIKRFMLEKQCCEILSPRSIWGNCGCNGARHRARKSAKTAMKSVIFARMLMVIRCTGS